MLTTDHAVQRIAERLLPEERSEVLRRIENVAADCPRGDVAIRVLRLSGLRGEAWSEQSNGHDVWAVVRGQKVATVMLRRKTQPCDKRAFNVDRVIHYKEN